MTIPRYASHVPRERLVRCLCRGRCGRLVYAETSYEPWESSGAKINPDLYATCLKCGYRATDEYNWIRV